MAGSRMPNLQNSPFPRNPRPFPRIHTFSTQKITNKYKVQKSPKLQGVYFAGNQQIKLFKLHFIYI